jgi:hypothetical protein
MATRWIETSFDLDGHRIGVSVRRLRDDEAARLAASLAWFASVALTPGADLDATDWPQVLQRILSDYVSLTVDDETLARREELWTPLCLGALRSFVTVNQIDPAVARHLVMLLGRAS